MTHCPSCGRYVGPYDACPYCSARLSGRLPVRTIKRTAVLLSTLGLAILWLAATRAEIPTVPLSQVGATANMAYVRVAGWVTRDPTYYADSGYLAFTLQDSTGAEVRVSAYRSETEALRAVGAIPALGDWVSVAGTLRVREDSVALTVNAPEHVALSRPEAEERTIDAITPDDHLRRVRVRAQVWSVRTPYDGLTLVTLRDAGGTIDVAITRNLEALTGAFLPVLPGQSVEVAAAVSLYQDAPQLVPASVRDVVLLPETIPIAVTLPVAALSEADAGRLVTVEGVVTEAVSFSAGFKVRLDDGSGSLTVLLWQALYDELPDPAALTPGARARVTGEVSLYQGELELIPVRAVDVERIAN
ncbi:MAG: hypothetical protein JXD18_02370 [Anaerolineae bacterium]|nr:hypothetical protein [Anaerolineae bacterium]